MGRASGRYLHSAQCLGNLRPQLTYVLCMHFMLCIFIITLLLLVICVTLPRTITSLAWAFRSMICFLLLLTFIPNDFRFSVSQESLLSAYSQRRRACTFSFADKRDVRRCRKKPHYRNKFLPTQCNVLFRQLRSFNNMVYEQPVYFFSIFYVPLQNINDH